MLLKRCGFVPTPDTFYYTLIRGFYNLLLYFYVQFFPEKYHFREGKFDFPGMAILCGHDKVLKELKERKNRHHSEYTFFITANHVELACACDNHFAVEYLSGFSKYYSRRFWNYLVRNERRDQIQTLKKHSDKIHGQCILQQKWDFIQELDLPKQEIHCTDALKDLDLLQRLLDLGFPINLEESFCQAFLEKNIALLDFLYNYAKEKNLLREKYYDAMRADEYYWSSEEYRDWLSTKFKK